MIRYFTGEKKILCGFTERYGGVSPFPSGAMNMSFAREKNRENVLENYRRAAEELGVEYGNLTRANQVHGNRIAAVDGKMRGRGISLPSGEDWEYDGLVTCVPGITLCTTHADCTPVLLYDEKTPSVGAVHSGWRSTSLGICEAAVRTMKEKFGTDPAGLKAVIGPSIPMNRFQVGDDVVDAMKSYFGSETLNREDILRKDSENEGKFYLNLPELVKITLLGSGLCGENITLDGSSTYDETERFFSYRREGINSGTMCSMICIL